LYRKFSRLKANFVMFMFT